MQIDGPQDAKPMVAVERKGGAADANAHKGVVEVAQEGAQRVEHCAGLEELEEEAVAVDAELEGRNRVAAGATVDVEADNELVEPHAVEGADMVDPPDDEEWFVGVQGLDACGVEVNDVTSEREHGFFMRKFR